jgi:Cu2+-exporting ATPase
MEGAVEEPGQGVRADVDGVEIRLGRPSFCGAAMHAPGANYDDPEASTITFVHGADVTVFVVRQRVRPDAVAVIARLRRQGFAVEILSGDREEAVAHVARSLGGLDYRAAMTPAEKIGRIGTLRQEGHNVLMVGDGLNDAPALAAADVSLSPVTAAHLTQAAADAIFLGHRLAPVPIALALARRARRIMHQNLLLAVVYNAIAVPVAICGLATPLIAAVAMSGSSLLVTVNALRAKVSPEET